MSGFLVLCVFFQEASDRQSMSDSAVYVLGTKYPGDESRTTEFKHYVGVNLLERIVQTAEKYVVAFLNAVGGTILFGVRDDGTIFGTHMNRCVWWRRFSSYISRLSF